MHSQAITPFWPRHCPHFLACRRAVREWCAQHVDGHHDRGVVIGLSGGADSLALVAAVLAERVPVHAVVIDHNLQEGSAQVAEKAAAQARKLGATAEIISVEVLPGNVESMARKARYAALGSAAIARNADIWIAHTADDQAETFLLSAMRGHATGMATQSELTVPGVGETRIIRPFLKVRRADTQGACSELELAYWSDPMNDDPTFLRVGLRHAVIPQLSELAGHDVVTSLALAAAHVESDNKALDQVLSEQISIGDSLDVKDLRAALPALRKRAIISFLHEQDLNVSAAALAHIEELVTHWHGQGGVSVGGDDHHRLEVVRKDGKLCVIPRMKGS